MSSVVIAGDTSGSVTLQAPAIAGSTVLTLPSTSGTLSTSTGPVLGTPVNTTSGIGIDFTGIPAGVKIIYVTFVGVRVSSAVRVYIRLGDSGGFEESGYLSSMVNLAGSGNAAFNGTEGNYVARTENGSAILHGIVTISLENSSTNTWTFAGNIAKSDQPEVSVSAGSKALSAVLDRLRITTTNDAVTFTAGQINISYQ